MAQPIKYALKADNATYGKVDFGSADWDRTFSYEIRIYDASGTKVAEIVSDMSDVTVQNIKFELLRNGGCGAFSFTLADEYTTATIDYNYKIELCFYTQPIPWFTGFITEVPKSGTDTIWKYAGYGYFRQLDYIRVNESDTSGQDPATMATGLLDDYVTPNTDIVKNTDKIEAVGYTTAATLKWERVTARRCFQSLAELAQDYEYGVDEELDFYFRAVDTTVLNKFWVGKHLTTFKPREDQNKLINRLYIRCGRLNDGTDYVLYREDASSQSTYGLRENVMRAPEFFPLFSTTDLANGKSVSTNPAGSNSGNLVDGDYTTYWESDTAQVSGHYIQVDLGASTDRIAKVVIDSIYDDCQEYYARKFKIEISADGNWAGEEIEVFASADSNQWKSIITFAPVTTRYIRVELTTSNDNEWRVGELEVYQLDTADIERWGDYIVSQGKDIKKRAIADIKGIDEIINRKAAIAPIKPTGQVGIYEDDGTKIDDYYVMACKYTLDSNGFNLRMELGELELSPDDELRRMLRQATEYDMSGVRNSNDLSNGTANMPGTITATHIGRDSIETIHFKGQKMSLYGGLVEAGEGVLTGGGHGFSVSDGTYKRFEAGKLNGDYGVIIRNAAGNITIDLGKIMGASDYLYALADNQISTTSTTFTDMANMSITHTFPKCIAAYFSVVRLDTSTDNALNGLTQFYRSGLVGYWAGIPDSHKVSCTNIHVEALSAGSHTIKIQWMTSDIDGDTLYATNRRLMIIFWEVQ